MITHQNVAWTIESLRRCIDFETYAGKRLVSYLPMAHIAERMVSHYQQAFLGYEVTCCPNPGDIAAYAREVRPQLMFGVPRVWEKLYGGVMGALGADPERAARFNGAVEAARPLVDAIDWGTATEEQIAAYEAMDAAAFANVRAMLGLDQVEVAITGAAPIPAELLSWFRAIRVPLSEIYGMSESSGPMTWTARRVKAGSVGPAIPGCEVELAEEDNEIICRGGNVFQGYLNDPEKTAETLDEDGWLHSGDIGEVDEDGYFTIVDRKKELIITAGGKNLSPANLEANLKLIPLVGQACAIGDNRPFVSALVVLDPEVATAWAGAQGIEFTDLNDLAQQARGAGRDREGPGRGDGVVQQRRTGQEGGHPRRGVAARQRRADADLEAQAPGRARQVRRGDRVDLRLRPGPTRAGRQVLAGSRVFAGVEPLVEASLGAISSGGTGRAEEEALAEPAAQGVQQLPLGLGLDALGHDVHVQAGGQVDDRPDDLDVRAHGRRPRRGPARRPGRS